MINEEHFLNVVGRVMSDQTRLPVDIDIRDAWFLVNAIQLATRHPEMRGKQKRMMEATARKFQKAITDRHPEADELLEMGWNPDFDDPLDELKGGG